MKPQTHKTTDKADQNPSADKKQADSKITSIKPALQSGDAIKVKGKWDLQIKAAKHEWSKLSEAELLKSDGNSQQLTGLVQQRYAIERQVAEKQVKAFLAKCNMA